MFNIYSYSNYFNFTSFEIYNFILLYIYFYVFFPFVLLTGRYIDKFSELHTISTWVHSHLL